MPHSPSTGRAWGHAPSTTLTPTSGTRLAELTSTTKEPNYESIEDTRLDRAVYAALAVAYEAFANAPYGTTPGLRWEETVYPPVLVGQMSMGDFVYDREEAHFKRLLEAQEMERAEHDDDA